MDDLELRIAALELLAIEPMAWQDRDDLLGAARSIQSHIDNGCDPEEAAVRRQALPMIEEGLSRFAKLRGPPKADFTP